jgi:fructose-specific PTS system IIA-like component
VPVTPEPYEYRFICPLPNGLHARPANRLEEVVSGFSSRVSVENLSNRKVANARSILSLVSADIKQGDECVLKVDGADCESAYHELVRFLRDELPACDEVLPEAQESSSESFVPPVLQRSGVQVAAGRGVVPGFGRGSVVFVEALVLPEGIDNLQTIDVEEELRKIDRTIVEHRSDLTMKLGSGRISKLESDVLKAHLSIANDVELIEKIHLLIQEKGLCAGKAILESFDYFSDRLNTAQSELIRERIVDLRDVCSQLLAKIYGSAAQDRIQLSRPSVCVADNMTPSRFIAIDKSLLAALVLSQVGNTSHIVILARSFGIPTLTGIRDTDRLLTEGQDVIVDANCGLLIPEINPQVERFYAAERRKRDARQQLLAGFRDKPAETRDGKRLEVMANVGTAAEVETAMANGAEGVGLFRTEMLFLGRNSAPSEEEQFEQYQQAARFAGGKPVIIRTFDIGGDKAVEYIQWKSEDNPFLGYRGVRVYKQHKDLLENQLRAILRASAFGTLKIMIPMVTCTEEVKYVRSVLEKVKAELDAAGISYDPAISLGIMVEVPSVAFFIPQLAGIIDFLSIGTNDLTQYFLAVDRGNGQVSSLYQSRHPGLLALIQKIVEDAHRHHLWVGMCGEMAGQTECLPLLLGTGLDEVSVSIPYVMHIKAACAEYDSSRCRELLQQAVAAETTDQVNAILSSHSHRDSAQPVIDVRLVDLDADCMNKEEVIKAAADMLFVNQRSENAFDLEKDFWKRETIYSTGLGHGFAVPHCKTAHITANSICVFRLKQPVDWQSIDEIPVKVVIAMTIRDSGEAGNLHMKIFSKLARNIMHEEFRERLRTIQNPSEIVAYLHEKLELDQQ